MFVSEELKSLKPWVKNQMESDEVVMEEVDLEEAFDIAGTGKYQVIHCIMMLTVLASALLEIIGNAFILPAAACDLNLPDNLRGIITSVPNIGVILTAAFWGRAADVLGRRPTLIVSCTAGGLIAFTGAFMPNLASFASCKFAASLFLACPSSLGFAYCGEMTPRTRRDTAVLILNGMLMLASSFSPTWGILSLDGGLHVGALNLRPWRLLTVAYAIPLLVAAAWVTQAKESPKFLMMKGKSHEALEVLRQIYACNTGSPKESFPVSSLKRSNEGYDSSESGSQQELTSGSQESALALLKPPHLKWLALTGFLMFGLFSLLNGLFLFAPDTINKVMSDTSVESETLCLLMNHQNETSSSVLPCDDSISHEMFYIMVVTTVAYGVVVMAASLLPVSKKTLLVAMFSGVGGACLISGLSTNRILAGAAMSALQVTSLGIGPLTAYAIRLFPTSLRGTAVGAVMLCGRLGSVVGANAAGTLLAAACNLTFYGFSAMLFLCAALSFLLPSDKTQPQTHLLNS